MKFGGTSVKDAPAMREVFEIVKLRIDSKPIIVLSACAGITNQLHQLVDFASKGKKSDCSKLLANIENHHLQVIENLISSEELKESAIYEIREYSKSIEQLIEGITLLGEATTKALDQIVTFGEIFSTCVFQYLIIDQGYKSEIIDARKLILSKNIDDNAVQVFEFIDEAKAIIVKKQKYLDFIITQGYMAVTQNGRTTTLGRGGSDYSAAIIGAGMSAKSIEIWTDVDGVYSCDPRILNNPKTIAQMSFSNIRTMAFFGAKVLHPEAIKPAIEKNIPVKILNTFNPSHIGTTIYSEVSQTRKEKAIAVVLKEDVKMLSIANIAEHDKEQIIATIIRRIKQNSSDIYYYKIRDYITQMLISNNIEDETLISLITDLAIGTEVSIRRKAVVSIVGLSDEGITKLLSSIIPNLEFIPELIDINRNDSEALLVLSKDNIADAYKDIHLGLVY